MSRLMLIGLAFAIPILASCVHDSTAPPVSTVPLLTLARSIERYRGQTVRTCGSSLSPLTASKVGELSAPHGRHGVGVHVRACREMKRVRGRRTCLTGRIARPDGSLRPLQPGEPISVSSRIIDYEWYLHQQCPA